MQLEQRFLVRLEDTGKGFLLSNKGMLTYFTNLACIHGNRVGQGLMDREKCGLSWMVVGWRFQVLSRPKLSQMVKGVTWAHNLSKIQTARDFLLYDEAGDLFAKGTSAWLVLDEHNTHVLRMTEEIMAPYGREEDHPAFPGYAFPKEAPAFEVERRAELTVSKAMIDCNDHVHNIAYLDLFDEALPEDMDMDRFCDVTLVYRREIKPREKVVVEFGRVDGGAVLRIREAEGDLVHAFLLLA